MSLPKIILDTDKTTPIYELPLKIRQGDTGDELQVTLGKSFQKYTDLSTVDVELIAKTPDQRLIKQPVTDKSGNTFKVKFPDEMYTNVGVFRNMYFKIGDDSTSSIKLVVLQGIGSIKEAGSYIDDFETLIEEAESYVLALKDFSDTGNAKIDDKVAELTGKMTDFVDKSKEDLDAAKAAWSTFKSNSETAASDQRDGFDTTFNKLISDDKATFKTISDEFNTTVDTAKSQNTANQQTFEAAETKRANDFKSQSDGFDTSYGKQNADFETRFKSYLDKLQSDYDSFKELLTNDVADLNKKLTDLGTDTMALQTQADKISNQLDSVDLTQMTTNKNDIASLKTQVNNSAVGTNLLLRTSGPFTMWNGTLNTVWNADKKRSELSLPTTVSPIEILPKSPSFFFNATPGISYTQSIYVSTDAPLTGAAMNVSWFTGTYSHNTNGKDDISSISKNVYRITSTLKWPDGRTDNNIRVFDLYDLGAVFDFNKGTFLYFYQPKIELGSYATDWCPNPAEIATDGSVQTAIKNALGNYSTTANVDSKISTGVGQAKTYAEQTIKGIIGAAPATLDTIGELADAVTKNKDGVQAINEGITKKADKTDVTALQNTVQTMITSISQEDYDALVSAGTVDPKILYVIPDA